MTSLRDNRFLHCSILPGIGFGVGATLISAGYRADLVWIQFAALTFLGCWTIGAVFSGYGRMSWRSTPWPARILGAFAALGFLGQLVTLIWAIARPHHAVRDSIVPVLTATLLIIFGSLLRIWAILINPHFFTGWDRRLSPGELCQSGPYRIMRHPGYAGAILMLVGVLIAYPSPLTALLTLSGILGYTGLAALEWKMISAGDGLRS